MLVHQRQNEQEDKDIITHTHTHTHTQMHTNKGMDGDQAYNIYSCVYIYILLRINSSRQHSKVLYRRGVKRKDRKIRKSRSEEKVVGFTSTSLFPARKWEAVTQGETRDVDHPIRRRTQGYCQRLGGQARQPAHSRYFHIKQE